MKPKKDGNKKDEIRIWAVITDNLRAVRVFPATGQEARRIERKLIREGYEIAVIEVPD